MSTKLADDSVVYAWNGSVSFGPPAVIQEAYDLIEQPYDFEPRVSEKQDNYESMLADYKKRGLIDTETGPMEEIVYHNEQYFPNGYIPGTHITAKEV